MKLTTTILFCVILTLQYNSADGNLKDFFGRIKESVDQGVNKVKSDLDTIIHRNDNNKDESTNIHFVEDESKEDLAAGAAKPQVPVTPPPSTSTTTPTQNGTMDKPGEGKDGRENFSGGCVAGYFRTADGRCKPSY